MLLHYVIKKNEDFSKKLNEIANDITINLIDIKKNKFIDEFMIEISNLNTKDVNLYNFKDYLQGMPIDLDVFLLNQKDEIICFVYFEENADISNLEDVDEKKRLVAIENDPNKSILYGLKFLASRGILIMKKDLYTIKDLISGAKEEDILEKYVYLSAKQSNLVDAVQKLMEYCENTCELKEVRINNKNYLVQITKF